MKLNVILENIAIPAKNFQILQKLQDYFITVKPKGEVEMKKGYSKITEFSDSLRWYELWRGISNAFMAFLEKILIIVGWYHPEESNEG